MAIVKNKYRGKKEYLLVHAAIQTAAKYRGSITYQNVAKIMGLPQQGNHMGSEVGYILGEISDEEVTNGRPMLSAIVVNAKGQVGPGFFILARKLGRLKNENEQDFLEKEQKLVYKTWRNDL